MRKGIRTQNYIAEKAAALFNTRGFAGTSMSDLLHATGLQNGGLYNHYPSKEALALAAFDFAVGKFKQRYAETITNQHSATNSLRAICTVMMRSYADPVVEGGCMVFNTALETDDAHPTLKARAQEAMRDLLRFIEVQVKLGQRSGELRSEVDPRMLATIIVSTCEGALGLSKLYDDAAYIQRAIAHLDSYIDTLKN